MIIIMFIVSRVTNWTIVNKSSSWSLSLLVHHYHREQGDQLDHREDGALVSWQDTMPQDMMPWCAGMKKDNQDIWYHYLLYQKWFNQNIIFRRLPGLTTLCWSTSARPCKTLERSPLGNFSWVNMNKSSFSWVNMNRSSISYKSILINPLMGEYLSLIHLLLMGECKSTFWWIDQPFGWIW